MTHGQQKEISNSGKSTNTPSSNKVQSDHEPPVEVEQLKLNYVFEIIKTCFIAIVSFVVLLWFGPGTAIATSLSLWFLSQRFADSLNHKVLNRGISPQVDKPPPISDNGVPPSLAELDWTTISKIPGVDAERLKDTFEYLYKRVHEGTLDINQQTGEWNEINENERSLQTKKQN